MRVALLCLLAPFLACRTPAWETAGVDLCAWMKSRPASTCDAGAPGCANVTCDNACTEGRELQVSQEVLDDAAAQCQSSGFTGRTWQLRACGADASVSQAACLISEWK